MSAKIPNGTKLALAKTYGTEKAITAISNANPGVASSVSHGVLQGGIVLIKSGWAGLNDRIFRAGVVASGTLEIEGQDTTNVVKFPIGAGVGSLQEITAWDPINQVTNLTSNGGETGFTDFSFLDEDFGRQIPNESSAISLTCEIADDNTQAGQIALQKASDSRTPIGLRMTHPNGTIWLVNAVVSLSPMPTMNKNEIMVNTATFSLQSRPVRYGN